jgi:hypothetical protein
LPITEIYSKGTIVTTNGQNALPYIKFNVLSLADSVPVCHVRRRRGGAGDARDTSTGEPLRRDT